MADIKKTKDVKHSMLLHRAKSASDRSKAIESGQVINPDKVNDNYLGLYSKGMTHDSSTMIAEDSLIKDLKHAMASGEQGDFDDLNKAGSRKQANPQAALAFEHMGHDPAGVIMDAPPALDSREAAAEMMEVYEKNILRDKTFADIEDSAADTDLDRAVATLNAFGSDFKGPKESGSVTRKSLFRGVAPGELVGPYVSQFLYLDVAMGSHVIEQKYNYEQGVYGISKSNYVDIQNGNVPVAQQANLASRKYVYTPRALGSVVHNDFVYQQFLYAAVILLSNGIAKNSAFLDLDKEGAFITNGGPADLATAVAEVSRHALKSAWVQKWINHLRLRPEAMAARIIAEEDGLISAGTVHAEVFTSGASTLAAVKAQNLANSGDNKAFLPLQFAEGSPTHPSYPAGHAVIAGACVTLLKCFFDGSQDWVANVGTVKHSIDGDSLVDYSGDVTGLTVNAELNKLASNIAIGRNMAGVHYRSDGDIGLLVGEKVAIEFMKDLRAQQNEAVGSFVIEKFDGTTLEF